MADANEKPKSVRQFWTRPRPKNNTTPNEKPKPERQFWTVPRSNTNTKPSEKTKPDKKPEPVKPPICHHHNGDCEADIPPEVLQYAGVPSGLYCETLEEERLRKEEELCLYAEYYHPE